MSTNKEEFLRKKGENPSESFSLAEIADMANVSKRSLQEVYNRGIGAYKTNLASVRLKKDFSKNPDTKRFPASSRLSKEQWAMARVYSFVNKGKTYRTADKDIAKQERK
jgi:hypothetical protein